MGNGLTLLVWERRIAQHMSVATLEIYAQCACEYCGNSIRFQKSYDGQKVECPHCGRAIVLGVSVPAVLVMREALGERIQLSRKKRMSTLQSTLGWLLFLSGFLSLLSSTVTPFFGEETLSRAMALIVSLLATGFGLILMLESRQSETYWVCSVCDHPLSSSETLICPACEAQLR